MIIVVLFPDAVPTLASLPPREWQPAYDATHPTHTNEWCV